MTKGNLSEASLNEQLKDIPGWSLKDGTLVREFVFSDFIETFAFMTELAIMSEKLNHHPEWRNVYNKLHIALTTHDAGGLTEKDIEWATGCNQRYNQQM
ncbi:4a-hydroxytetrahydrobiopterin dehydratase [bacterium]|jgi:4a-hydroxytetrahydrobiopterin dehydratase|nr:4a-hydroxytetrahydrobiopterin dehydratase [bacterium]